MIKKMVSFRPAEESQQFLLALADSLSAGSEFGIEAFRALYAAELRRVRGVFTAEELTALVAAVHPQKLIPLFLGEHIAQQGCAPEIMEKWAGLPRFSRACLEIWARGFWRGDCAAPDALEKYAGKLV